MSSWEREKKMSGDRRLNPHPDAPMNISYYNRTTKNWEFDYDPLNIENSVTVRIHDPKEYIVLQISYQVDKIRMCFNISLHQANNVFTKELDSALSQLKNLKKGRTKMGWGGNL
jgi:hypothetical protein